MATTLKNLPCRDCVIEEPTRHPDRNPISHVFNVCPFCERQWATSAGTSGLEVTDYYPAKKGGKKKAS